MALDAFIVDAIRTPRGKGKKDGSLFSVKPIDLLTQLMHQLLQRGHLADSCAISDVVLGCVTPIGDQGGNIAKAAALKAQWSDQVSGVQVNRFCASGLEAVNLAAVKVSSQTESLVVAGGVESMSRCPIGSDGGPWMQDPETGFLTHFIPQGISADLIATLEGFDREMLDQFALDSQKKAHQAQLNNAFKKSLIPVTDINGQILLAQDEYNRPQTELKDLAALKSAFAGLGTLGFDQVALQKYTQLGQIQHHHTAGNSSGIVDGSALVLVANQKALSTHRLKPRAQIISMALVSTEPTLMLTGPVPAIRLAVERAGLKIADIDLFEINEAFASVVLKTMRDLDIDPQKVNVNGGSIALGHPLGATGAMLLGTALDELELRQKRHAVISLCVGGGMGIATVIERLD
jgi:acetyl-CoA C-acetyltransferase